MAPLNKYRLGIECASCHSLMYPRVIETDPVLYQTWESCTLSSEPLRFVHRRQTFQCSSCDASFGLVQLPADAFGRLINEYSEMGTAISAMKLIFSGSPEKALQIEALLIAWVGEKNAAGILRTLRGEDLE